MQCQDGGSPIASSAPAVPTASVAKTVYNSPKDAEQSYHRLAGAIQNRRRPARTTAEELNDRYTASASDNSTSVHAQPVEISRPAFMSRAYAAEAQIASKNSIIAKKNRIIAQRDSVIAKQELEIANLRSRLAEEAEKASCNRAQANDSNEGRSRPGLNPQPTQHLESSDEMIRRLVQDLQEISEGRVYRRPAYHLDPGHETRQRGDQSPSSHDRYATSHHRHTSNAHHERGNSLDAAQMPDRVDAYSTSLPPERRRSRSPEGHARYQRRHGEEYSDYYHGEQGDERSSYRRRGQEGEGSDYRERRYDDHRDRPRQYDAPPSYRRDDYDYY